MFSAIVFDFDGVLIESADIKMQAFNALFSRFPAHADKISAYLSENAGVSRYTKFRHVYENLVGLPLSQEMMDSLDHKFSELVSAEIRQCPFVPGVLDFIKKRAPECPLFVVSATPEAELVSITTDRGLAHFFEGIYGAPSLKTSILRSIQQRIGRPPDTLLLIGDSLHDYHAATEVGTRFVGRLTGTSAFAGLPVVLVKDFEELESIWSCFSQQPQ
jgi:phosphoglycolate phosphatase